MDMVSSFNIGTQTNSHASHMTFNDFLMTIMYVCAIDLSPRDQSYSALL